MHYTQPHSRRAFTILESLIVLVVLVVFSMIGLALYWHHVRTEGGFSSAPAIHGASVPAIIVGRAS